MLNFHLGVGENMADLLQQGYRVLWKDGVIIEIVNPKTNQQFS